jgi:hypothetical protein
MMSHINKGDIHAYLDGALGAYPEEAARYVREHLDACPECAQLLEVEGRLRQDASAIIAASAQGPVELDPLDELLARASALDGQERAQELVESGWTGGTRRSVGSRIYMLRWVATVVVSLGAGWVARDVAGPADDVARRVVGEPVLSETGLRRAADQERAELDNIGEPAEAETLRESVGAVTGRLAEVEAQLESPDASVVVGGGLAADRDAGGFDDDAVLDQVEAVSARQREESAVTRDVAVADANTRAQAADPQVQALAPSDELRRSAPAVDRRYGASLRGNAASAPASSNSLSTTSFLVPGLPVRDVRLAPGADGSVGAPGGSVVVTQELSDGRIIELQFVPLAGSDAVVGGAFQERSDFLGRIQPAGWAMVVHDVPGGMAVLSGPLTELELAELLNRALGLR